jgi:hypothetical protein
MKSFYNVELSRSIRHVDVGHHSRNLMISMDFQKAMNDNDHDNDNDQLENAKDSPVAGLSRWLQTNRTCITTCRHRIMERDDSTFCVTFDGFFISSRSGVAMTFGGNHTVTNGNEQ